MLSNIDLRETAKKSGVRFWEICEVLQISEPTMTRLLRRELPDEKKEQIRGIIQQLAQKDGVKNAG